MKFPKRLFRRRPDPDRGRVGRARALYEAAVSRGEVQCRLCDRAGVHVHSFETARGVGFFALCGPCHARPEATSRGERASKGEPPPGWAGPPAVVIAADDPIDRDSLA